jgi:hypothetical protein
MIAALNYESSPPIVKERKTSKNIRFLNKSTPDLLVHCPLTPLNETNFHRKSISPNFFNHFDVFSLQTGKRRKSKCLSQKFDIISGVETHSNHKLESFDSIFKK